MTLNIMIIANLLKMNDYVALKSIQEHVVKQADLWD